MHRTRDMPDLDTERRHFPRTHALELRGRLRFDAAPVLACRSALLHGRPGDMSRGSVLDA